MIRNTIKMAHVLFTENGMKFFIYVKWIVLFQWFLFNFGKFENDDENESAQILKNGSEQMSIYNNRSNIKSPIHFKFKFLIKVLLGFCNDACNLFNIN